MFFNSKIYPSSCQLWRPGPVCRKNDLEAVVGGLSAKVVLYKKKTAATSSGRESFSPCLQFLYLAMLSNLKIFPFLEKIVIFQEIQWHLKNIMGNCRYPIDRLPLYTSFKSIRELMCASTRYHIPCSSRLRLPVEVGIDVPRVPRPWASPPYRDRLWRCHMS
jgi:hypothetical protein